MLRPVKSAMSGAPFLARKEPAQKMETRLTFSDHLHAIALRFGIGRDRASLVSGLYYTGTPNADSPVLVSANYRLSVDALRKELHRVSVWILVVDTGGVNVWCAAGKGSFSAKAVIKSMQHTALNFFAPSAPLILPQLSASGVNANELAAASGRRVLFGPVYARDIPLFIESGFKKDASMRRVHFSAAERAVLIPVELMHTIKFQLMAIVLPLFISLPVNEGFFSRVILYAAYLEGSLLLSVILFPLLLPFLPGRFFSVKGTVLHVIWTVFFCMLTWKQLSGPGLFIVPLFFLAGGVSAYITMNFTGSSSFTSQRGVELEVKRSIPPILVSIVLGVLSSAGMFFMNLFKAGVA